MATSSIEWLINADGSRGKVWNPVVGCTPVSAGCAHCYAKVVYERFHPGESFSEIKLHPEKLDDPYKWKNKTHIIFVNSMSDIFHRDVNDKFIDQIFARMKLCWWNYFVILTKRPQRMLDYFNRWTNGGLDTPGIVRHEALELKPGDSSAFSNRWPLLNVWLGVSVEDQKTADERIPLLLQTPAAKRIVSVEPQLENVDIYHSIFGHKPHTQFPLPPQFSWTKGGGLDWIICGSESGPGARPFDINWARSLRDQCQAANVPFFLKQMPVDGKLVKMPELDGVVYNQFPR